jgi:hypothetical protein
MAPHATRGAMNKATTICGGRMEFKGVATWTSHDCRRDQGRANPRTYGASHVTWSPETGG